jgi:glycosyltransferase involved in cell wall biosynthesis
VIVAHAENPQVYQLYELKKKFPNTITCLVFHGVDYLGRPQFKDWREKYLPKIDKFGFRSESILKKAKELLAFDREYFMCPSGIANEFVLKDLPKKSGMVRKFIYVGQLIERKHLKTLVEALSRYPERNYELTVIGVGPQKDEDEQLAKKLGVKTTFLGKLPHQQVIKEMGKADCFVMVSENEVFGLVYLEAMAQGCITIASEKEGMDGIISHGKNGYLISAGNVDALMNQLDEIEMMDTDDINLMRRAGLELANRYSESAVAEHYLSSVVQ